MTGPGPDGPQPDPEPQSAAAVPQQAPKADGPALAEPEGAPAEPERALGSAIFSLEGRRAPGLYLMAWILSVGGLAVTFVLGPLASDPDWGTVLIFAGAVAVTLGLAAGAGAQVLERAARVPERYRGPAPLLVFGVYFFAMSLIGLVLLSVLDIDPDRPFNFLGIAVVQAGGYVLVVWLFGIRTSALSWRDMGWPTWRGPALGEMVHSLAVAVLVMLPVTMVLLVVGGLVGLLLCTDAPQVLPLSETFADGVFVALAAAIVIPVGEEIFFRGFAQTAWTRDLGPRTALLRTTAFFAIVHVVNIDAPTFSAGLSQAALTLVVLLPVGYVLGWLFARQGLLAAMAGHITYNSLLLLLAYLASRIPEPTEPVLRGWCG